MKKQKSPFDRAIEDGFAIMNDEEHKNQIRTLRDQETIPRQKYDNLIYLFLGAGLGIIGGYISTWIYEITRRGWSFQLIDMIFILIFIVLILLLSYKLNEYKSKLKMLEETRKLFEKNNVIITNEEKFNKYLKSRRSKQ